MLHPNLCDHRSRRDNSELRQADEVNKGVTFRNCAPFTNCISKINNTRTENVKGITCLCCLF